MSGIERKIDNLGRVVIPVGFRKRLGIDRDSRLIMSLENDMIIIRSNVFRCALCSVEISEDQNLPVCDVCRQRIKNED